MARCVAEVVCVPVHPQAKTTAARMMSATAGVLRFMWFSSEEEIFSRYVFISGSVAVNMQHAIIKNRAVGRWSPANRGRPGTGTAPSSAGSWNAGSLLRAWFKQKILS